MKIFRFILLSLFGLMALNACEAEKDSPENPLDNGNQVKFQGVIGVPDLHANATSWNKGAAIGVYALNEGGTLPSGLYDGKENVKYTTPGTGAFTAADVTNSILFPEKGALDFIAYYPYRATINDYRYVIDVANQSNSSAIDLLYSDDAKGVGKSGAKVPLTFKHMLSLLVMNISADDMIPSLDGLTASIKQLKTDGTFNLVNKEITAGTTVNAVTPAGTVTGKSGTLAAILVPGQNLKDAKIIFTLKGEDYVWEPETSVVLDRGKKYTYKIQLSSSGKVIVQPEGSIIDWEDAETGTDTIVINPDDITGDFTPIADVRAMYKGADVTIGGDIKIKAVVVQNRAGGNSTSRKNIVVQDETAGITIRLANDDDTFDFGDEVEIGLKDQVLSAYNGLIQINNLVNANVTKVGAKTVTAGEITAAQLITGQYESQYVAVSDVQVVEGDLGKPFAPAAGGHGSINMESRAGEYFVMFTASFATFKSETVPQGSGTLKGIASVNNGVYQVLPTVLADSEGMTNPRFGESDIPQTFYSETFDGVTPEKTKFKKDGTGLSGFDFAGGLYTGTGADARTTTTIKNKHIWFPAYNAKYENAFVKISGIPSGYTKIKLSYDLAANGPDINAKGLMIQCNDQDITPPDLSLGDQNKYSAITLDIPFDDVTTLHFYTDEANTKGFRLDNIKLEGVKK